MEYESKLVMPCHQIANHRYSPASCAVAWQDVQKRKLITTNELNQDAVKDNRRNQLFNRLHALGRKWPREADMHKDLCKVINDCLFTQKHNILSQAHDTHATHAFPADISISEYSDSRLPYALRFFIQLKLPTDPKRALDTDTHCGQMLYYLNNAREMQPNRTTFVGILSDTFQTYLFIADYSSHDGTHIIKMPFSFLADALIYADNLEATHIESIPIPKEPFSNSEVLAVSKHHYLYSAELKRPKQQSKDQLEPTLFRNEQRLVIKIARRDRSLKNEIQNNPCPSFSELVWCTGLTPCGDPITFKEPPDVSRAIVRGVIDGLKQLHTLGIVHRDIRPSNVLVLNKLPMSDGTPIIIDLESAVVRPTERKAEYYGGYIYRPKQLLESDDVEYEPKPEDDLRASIIMLQHMLFPHQFGKFDGEIGPLVVGVGQTPQAKRVLKMWGDVERSSVWGRYVVAADALDYRTLKDMASIFV